MKVGDGTPQQIKRERTERNLALQFAITGVVLCIAGLSFTGIPQITSNPWYFLMLSEFYLIYSVCNPIIYLLFNNLIRKHFKELFCESSTSTSVSAITNNHNSTLGSRAVW
jgi:hypothetical protein